MRHKQDKDALRKLFLSLRRLIPAEEKHKADQVISDKVLTRNEWQKAQTVCLYMSTLEEVDTKPLLAAALTAGKTVVFPRVEKKRLILRQITSTRDFTRGAYHILEPKKSCRIIEPGAVDLFIVPGIAFDRDKYRLGWGKGYYDMLLAGIDAPKIGLAYATQLIAQLPHTSYDVPMTIVITEEGIYAS